MFETCSAPVHSITCDRVAFLTFSHSAGVCDDEQGGRQADHRGGLSAGKPYQLLRTTAGLSTRGHGSKEGRVEERGGHRKELDRFLHRSSFPLLCQSPLPQETCNRLLSTADFDLCSFLLISKDLWTSWAKLWGFFRIYESLSRCMAIRVPCCKISASM